MEFEIVIYSQVHGNHTYGYRFWDFQLRSFVDHKPVDLGESFIIQYHALDTGYYFPQCTDTPNFICAIKQ